MKHLFPAFLLFAFLATTPLLAQKNLPDAEVQTLDREKVSIKDYIKEDKITVISFWATWCKPCKLELDTYMDFYSDWQKNYNVEIIAVSIDTERALPKVKPTVDSKGWTYTVLTDPNRIFHQAIGGQNVPHTIIVKNGEIVFTHTGYQPGDEEELEKHFQALSKADKE